MVAICFAVTARPVVNCAAATKRDRAGVKPAAAPAAAFLEKAHRGGAVRKLYPGLKATPDFKVRL